MRISRREHEKGTCPLSHISLDAQVDGEHSLLDQLEAPAAELASALGAEELALEQLVEQLPAAQATALRLTLLEGLSLRAAGLKLGISAMAVQRAQKKAIAALRLQLVGGGLRALMHRPVPSAHAPWLAVDRPHHRPQRRRDLQLLFGPVGRQGCQKAASVAVNTEHGVS